MISTENKSSFPLEVTTSAQTLFDERRDSFRQCLSAILDKFNTTDVLISKNSEFSEIENRIESIISKYLTTERETFLSYLIFLFMKNQKQIMPPFFEEFRESKEKLDKLFDKKGIARKCLSRYSNIVNVSYFPKYVSKIASIFFGTMFLHSIVNDYRLIINKFISNTKRLIHDTNKKAIITLQKVSNHKIIQKKDEEIKTLLNQLNKIKEILKERDKNRLEIEGLVIRIIQYINSIDPKKVEDTSTQLTLEELKKQSKSLRNVLKATTSNDKIEFNNNISNLTSNTNMDDLIRQSRVKDETILQLRKELDMLRKSSSATNSIISTTPNLNSISSIRYEESVLQSNLLKTKGELMNMKATKSELMNEVIQKTDKLRDYYEMKAEFEDLKLEYHALKQQKIQSDEYAETLNQENIKLRKNNEELKTQLSSGNAGFEALYDKVNRLDDKLKRRKEKLQEEKDNSSKIEIELHQKNLEIQTYMKKLKSLTEDHESNSMKNDLLMEQITNLKTEMAMKENDFAKFHENFEAQKKLYDTAQERENEKINEINMLKDKIEKTKLKMSKKEEKNQQLQKLIESSTIKIQEKNLLMEKYELKINDLKSKIVTLTEKLGKATDIIKNLKTKVKELENTLADLHFKMKENERQKQMNDNEMKELREMNKNMIDISKAKEELERQLFQIKLELESSNQKNEIINSNLNSQLETSEQLRKELSDTKKKSADIANQYETLKFQNQTQISQLKNEINSVKYDADKEKERFEKEKVELTNRIQQTATKVKSINQMKEQYESQISDLKQKNVDLQDQLTESNAQSKQKYIELQHITQQERLELNEKIAASEKNTKESEAKNATLIKQFNNVKDDYDDFKIKIIQMLNLQQKKLKQENEEEIDKNDILSISENLIYKKIQDIQTSLSTADSFMNTFNNEINKAKDRNQSFFDEVAATSLSTSMITTDNKNVSPFEQISMLTQAVDVSAQIIENYKKQQEHQNQILKQNQITNFDEIPELNKQLNEAKQEALLYQSIIRQVGESMPFERMESLPRIIAELKLNRDKLQTENNKYNRIMKLMHKYVVFDNDEDVVNTIKELSNEDKRKSNQINLLNKDFQETLKTKSNYEEKLIQIAQILNVQNFDEIPQQVEMLSVKNQQNQSNLDNFQSNYNSIVGQISQIMDISENNNNNSNSPVNLKKQSMSIVSNVRNLSSANQKISSELRSTRRELDDKNDLLSNVKQIIEVQEEAEIPRNISNLIEKNNFYEAELKKNKDKHNNFVYQLSSITNTSEEEKIPLTIIKIYQQQKETLAELESVKRDHQDFVDSIQQVLPFKSEKQLPKILNNMIEKQKILDSRAELLDQVEKMTLVKDDSQLLKTIGSIYQESQDHQKMMKKMKSFVSFSDAEEATKTIQEKVSILSQIQNSLSLDNQADLPMRIEDLKETSQSHNSLLSNVQSYLNFESEEQIPSKIKEIVNRSAEQSKVLSNIERFVVPTDADDNRTLTNGSLHLTNSMFLDNENTEISISKSNIQNIPQFIEKMVNDNKVVKKKYFDLISSLQELLSFNDENEIPMIISKLINSNTKKQEKIQFSRSIFQSIHECVPFDQIEDIPQMIFDMSQTIQKFVEKEKKYQEIFNESRRIVDLDDLESLPQKISDLKKVEKTFEKVVSNLQTTLDAQDLNEIISKVNVLVNDQDKSVQTLKEINSITPIPINSIDDVMTFSKHIRSVLESIKPIINVDVVSDINKIDILPQIFKNLKETESHYSKITDLFKQILLRIYGNQSQIITSLSFPLSDEQSKKIISSISDYSNSYESMKLDFNKLLSSARSLGYSGSSCVEASDFLAEELCKKKAQEQLEEMVNQMKKLREDKDRERKLFEQRNAKNNEKIKQVREAKAQLIEQYSQKQSELYDTIESLQKETRELGTKVEKLSKVKEELIRVASNEPYDKESLLTWLTSAEKVKLKL
ncbi:hypothetical protein M9Y10_025696 [Tritrichomonas musculus]|uniref:Viral A-type inclusion protein n=1 Tax=Tritrichomonas musculus TaxID=1915356 RepID=A0ABR2H9D5_9EUKA